MRKELAEEIVRWIAAATMDCGGQLLTFDRHFDRVAGLDSWILPV